MFTDLIKQIHQPLEQHRTQALRCSLTHSKPLTNIPSIIYSLFQMIVFQIFGQLSICFVSLLLQAKQSLSVPVLPMTHFPGPRNPTFPLRCILLCQCPYKTRHQVEMPADSTRRLISLFGNHKIHIAFVKALISDILFDFIIMLQI